MPATQADSPLDDPNNLQLGANSGVTFLDNK